jgi:alkanesulfonate monooxygenase SsuD/methylene tetrahydromethanopterin reductase-like flavin-dependent oxidoreductase (luciferase family)
MKVGLIYEIESVKPHAPDHEYRVFQDSMAQVELADRVGFDSVWAVEHHFLSEFSYSSAPEVFLACVSQRTRQIRLGHGVAVLPFNHPIRVAERVAVLDIMSNGRVELGTGRSTTMDEIVGFGLTPDETRPRWREAIDMIPRMWLEDPFTYEGRYWSVKRPVSVIPKPLQKPHPPLWVAAVSSETFQVAGECGLGALGFTLGVELEKIAERIGIFRNAVRNARPLGGAINDQISLNLICLAGDDPDATERIAREAVVWYARRGFELIQEVAQNASAENAYRYLEHAARVDAAEITGDYYDFLKSEDLLAIGDAAEIIRVASRYHALGIDQLLLFIQYGRIPHEAVMRSIEIIGERVLPELRQWPTPGGIRQAVPKT